MNRRRSTLATAVAAAAALLAAPLLTAPAASAATERSTTITDYWYASFLGRTPQAIAADPGRLAWADRLDAGDAPVDVLDDLTRSREYAENQVQAYYSVLLGREPDAGAEVWIRGMTGDMEEEWVVQNVLTAPERTATEIDGYLGSLCTTILGRSPSAGEEAYWTERWLQLGKDNLGLVREIWYTPEAVGDRITLHYVQQLGRQPSAAEVNYWRASERASDLSTRVAIAASDEGLATALRLGR